MPKLDGILETAIHTEDMVRSRAFYEDVLGLEPIYSENRLSAYAVAGRDVLLVFRKGTTGQTVTLPSGTIPGHGGDGALHVAFAIGKDELVRWEAHLASRGVTIEGRNDWSRGGRSIYFRDPDGHLLELATLVVGVLDRATLLSSDNGSRIHGALWVKSAHSARQF
jgi:catechol 2,3-dioxygenase-like lactoylglutathione lyase family enzyme